ncbi:hypothetical protein SH661x_003487 [Planctomicrobium sp. SH661]|uniref:hypothetical protein n=1 Tax=Planctomicrobium sp. SH661 TaxID=3448124 RepID=UPI003F5B3648
MPFAVLKRYSTMLLALLSMAGCASLVDSHYEHTQRLRTELAYLKFWWHSEDACGHDYKAGWKAGYLDVTTGGDGQPPMFAPHCYWSPSQILCHCDQKRNEWYTGFQDGAMIASCQPDTHYLKVWAPPPVCQYPPYSPAESGSTTSEPALAPPSDSPGLMPTPQENSASPMNPGTGAELPMLPEGKQLPPVPERPMPVQ